MNKCSLLTLFLVEGFRVARTGREKKLLMQEGKIMRENLDKYPTAYDQFYSIEQTDPRSNIIHQYQKP